MDWDPIVLREDQAGRLFFWRIASNDVYQIVYPRTSRFAEDCANFLERNQTPGGGIRQAWTEQMETWLSDDTLTRAVANCEYGRVKLFPVIPRTSEGRSYVGFSQ
jgi:hypothetical protein